MIDEFVRLDGGRLFVLNEPKFLSALKDHTFDELWSLPFEKTVKFARKERMTGYLHLESLGKVYIKKGEFNILKGLFDTLRKFTKQLTSFRGEAEALLRLKELGVRTTPLVAFGIKKRFFKPRSLLITEDVGEHPRLKNYFPKHYGKTSSGESFKNRCRFIRRLAEIIKKMHDGGINHRDLYATHIFVTGGEGNEDFIILDLNRADIRKKVPERWVAKDLAALAATTPHTSITDRIRFLKDYLNIERLDERAKRLVRRIGKRLEKLKTRIERSEAKDREFIEKHRGTLPD